MSSRRGVTLATALLGLTVAVLLLAAWFHFVAPDNGPPKTRYGARAAGIIQSPLAIATWVLVVFEVGSLTLAMIDQYPAWSVGRSNLEAVAGLKTGKSCGLAEDVLVEQDAGVGMLAPVNASAADALGAGLSEAFTPNGIPADVRADPVMERPGDRSFVNDEEKTGSNQAHPRAAPPPRRASTARPRSCPSTSTPRAHRCSAAGAPASRCPPTYGPVGIGCPRATRRDRCWW